MNMTKLRGDVINNSRIGRLDEAERICREIINLDKDNIFAHVNLANLLLLKGNTDDAIKEYEYAKGLRPEDLAIRENLALALINKGEYVRAEIEINELLKINSNFPSAYNLLGNIYFLKRDFQKAKRYYEMAIELDADLGDARSNLGNVYFEWNSFNKAEECYRRAVQINPNNSYWYGNLGKALIKQEKFELAIESYKKALEIGPELKDYKKILCSIYIILGERLKNKRDLEGAYIFYEKAIALDNGNASLYSKLAEIKLILCDYAGVYRHLEDCKRNCPDVDLTKYPFLSRFK